MPDKRELLTGAAVTINKLKRCIARHTSAYVLVEQNVFCLFTKERTK